MRTNILFLFLFLSILNSCVNFKHDNRYLANKKQNVKITLPHLKYDEDDYNYDYVDYEDSDGSMTIKQTASYDLRSIIYLKRCKKDKVNHGNILCKYIILHDFNLKQNESYEVKNLPKDSKVCNFKKNDINSCEFYVQ